MSNDFEQCIRALGVENGDVLHSISENSTQAQINQARAFLLEKMYQANNDADKNLFFDALLLLTKIKPFNLEKLALEPFGENRVYTTTGYQFDPLELANMHNGRVNNLCELGRVPGSAMINPYDNRPFSEEDQSHILNELQKHGLSHVQIVGRDFFIFEGSGVIPADKLVDPPSFSSTPPVTQPNTPVNNRGSFSDDGGDARYAPRPRTERRARLNNPGLFSGNREAPSWAIEYHRLSQLPGRSAMTGLTLMCHHGRYVCDLELSFDSDGCHLYVTLKSSVEAIRNAFVHELINNEFSFTHSISEDARYYVDVPGRLLHDSEEVLSHHLDIRMPSQETMASYIDPIIKTLEALEAPIDDEIKTGIYRLFNISPTPRFHV